MLIRQAMTGRSSGRVHTAEDTIDAEKFRELATRRYLHLSLVQISETILRPAHAIMTICLTDYRRNG